MDHCPQMSSSMLRAELFTMAQQTDGIPAGGKYGQSVASSDAIVQAVYQLDVQAVYQLDIQAVYQLDIQAVYQSDIQAVYQLGIQAVYPLGIQAVHQLELFSIPKRLFYFRNIIPTLEI